VNPQVVNFIFREPTTRRCTTAASSNLGGHQYRRPRTRADAGSESVGASQGVTCASIRVEILRSKSMDRNRF
jgi:hypothetical protein